MKSKNAKKTPADYPQMIFRLSQEDKDRIAELVESVTDRANAAKDETHRKFRKNDIIVDALFLGLLTLDKKLAKIERR